jgi:hypothetical protein
MNVTKEKLKELWIKLEEERNKKEKFELYQPPTITDDEIKENNFSNDFVESQKYLSRHYKELSEKYGDKTWLIIGKSGVIEYSDNFNVIHKILYERGYAGSTVLSLVGQKRH